MCGLGFHYNSTVGTEGQTNITSDDLEKNIVTPLEVGSPSMFVPFPNKPHTYSF